MVCLGRQCVELPETLATEFDLLIWVPETVVRRWNAGTRRG